MTELHTEHLILRRWRASDREPFARINADARVMEFYPSSLTREQSDAMADRIEARFSQANFGLWAVELRHTAAFIGYIGLSTPAFEAHFTRPSSPAVEIGWRLAPEHWGRGLATEGARAALEDGFHRLHLPEIVSFTAVGNLRSQKVMEKLGMTHDPAEDFDHPALAVNHPLRRHVLYRIRRDG